VIAQHADAAGEDVLPMDGVDGVHP
jgi:hypothetical protein